MRYRWIAVATEIFSRTKCGPDGDDIALLAESMALLDAAGLQKLNQRLTQANRNIFDTIAEVNFAVMLLRYRGASGIEYEPPDYGRRPIDFRITHKTAVIHLQMKRFSDLERQNRRDAVYERIKRESAGINVRKYFEVTLTEEFSDAHVRGLMQLLEAVAPSAIEGYAYEFKVGSAIFARVEIRSPRSILLPHLTLGAMSDAEAINITGLATEQLRASLRKTTGAFNFPVDNKNLNLVVAESDKHDDIDICEACFGTEEELFAKGIHTWHRLGDGVFSESEIAEKVAGLIVLRRSDRGMPVSNYEAVLLVNELHLKWVDEITKAIPISKVIRYNMRS
jgi:hypothetical protein